MKLCDACRAALAAEAERLSILQYQQYCESQRIFRESGNMGQGFARAHDLLRESSKNWEKARAIAMILEDE